MATEYDFSKAQDLLTRCLHYEFCYMTECEGKEVNDPMCRRTDLHQKAAFMIAAIAPHFIDEIRGN